MERHESFIADVRSGQAKVTETCGVGQPWHSVVANRSVTQRQLFKLYMLFLRGCIPTCERLPWEKTK